MLRLYLYARVRFFVRNFAHETAGAASTRHSLLPLLVREQGSGKARTRSASRERERTPGCRHPPTDRADARPMTGSAKQSMERNSETGLLRRFASGKKLGLSKTPATTKLSSPGLTGRSSTPRPLDSIAGVSGILGRPVKPGDDSGVCFIHQGRPQGRYQARNDSFIQIQLRNPAARCARGL